MTYVKITVEITPDRYTDREDSVAVVVTREGTPGSELLDEVVAEAAQRSEAAAFQQFIDGLKHI